MTFEPKWEEHISILRKGQTISIVGQIERIERFSVHLRSCELISA
jgi:hypothetical protein